MSKFARRPQRLIQTLLVTALAALAAWTFLWPAVWMVSSASRPEADIFKYLSPLSVYSMVPTALTSRNVQIVLATSGFARAVVNSVIVSGATCILGLVCAVPAAFALAVLRFPMRGAAFVALFISFSVPFDLVAIPLATQFRDLGLANTYTGLVLPGLANGFAILLLRQFFAGVPPQLHEAARVDGSSWLRILVEIYLPLAKPALVAAGIILFLSQWQAYLWPLLIGTDSNMQLGPIALANMSGGIFFTTQFGAIFAGAALLAIIPTAILLLFQRTFVASLASSGSTG